MKCNTDKYNKKDPQGVIVRRKFVPIKFSIHRENQFLNAGTKLPYTTAKVIGVLTTSTIHNKCNDLPLPPRYYYGISDSEMIDTRFLQTNRGSTFTSQYPPDGFFNGPTGTHWWYYIHPILDRFPVLLDNGMYQSLTNPITLEIKQEGQCTPEHYYLWSGKLPDTGFSLVTFFPPT